MRASLLLALFGAVAVPAMSTATGSDLDRI